MSFCLLLSATTFAQQVQEFTISGTVVDKDKLSMPGVSVYIKDKPLSLIHISEPTRP